MTVTLTSDEMLRIWRRRAGLEPSATGCTVERFDGVDVDGPLRDRMRAWYLKLLDEGDPNLIGEPQALDGLVGLTVSPAGEAVVTLAPQVRRITSLQLDGWQRPTPVLSRAEASDRIAMLGNPYSRPGNACPLAWRDSDGVITAIPARSGSKVCAARGFVDTGSDLYRIDERAIDTVPADFPIY